MAASDSSHMKKYDFYNRLIPTPEQFQDLQNGAYDAFKRLQARFITSSARLVKAPAASIGAGFSVGILENAGIDRNGLAVDWETTLVFDATQSTHGSYIGPTAPASGSRFIILAVAHKEVEADFRTSLDGNTYPYEYQSTTEARVYALSSDTAVPVWTTNAGLSALWDAVVADDAIPVMICERRNGTTNFAASDLHPAYNTVSSSEDIASALEELDIIFSRNLMAFIDNDTGLAAIVASAVPGGYGRVVVTGGEEIVFFVPALSAEKYRSARPVRVTLPAATFNLTQTQVSVIRAKIDTTTLAVTVYLAGTEPSTIADHLYENAEYYPGPFSVGDVTHGGHARTTIDIPVAVVMGATDVGFPPAAASQIDNRIDSELVDNRIDTAADSRYVTQGHGEYASVGQRIREHLLGSGLQNRVSFPTTFVAGGVRSIRETGIHANIDSDSMDYAPFLAMEDSASSAWTRAYLLGNVATGGRGGIIFTVNAWYDEADGSWNQDFNGADSYALMLGGSGVQCYRQVSTVPGGRWGHTSWRSEGPSDYTVPYAVVHGVKVAGSYVWSGRGRGYVSASCVATWLYADVTLLETPNALACVANTTARSTGCGFIPQAYKTSNTNVRMIALDANTGATGDLGTDGDIIDIVIYDMGS